LLRRGVPLPSSKPASLHVPQAATQHGITALALKTDTGAAGPLAALAERIELWPIEKLRPYERNPRTHSEAQVDQIAASIVEFGWTNPILIDENAGISRADRPRMPWRPGIGRRFAQGMDLVMNGLPETDTQLRCSLCEPDRCAVRPEDAWKFEIDRLFGEPTTLVLARLPRMTARPGV
jgi:hypothetical protein